MTLLTGAYLVILGLDRVTKLWAVSTLTPGVSVRLTSFLDATLVFNKGGAFGLGAGLTWLLVTIRLVVAFGVFFAARPLLGAGAFGALALGLLGGGALGNLIDHFVYGHVIDFIDLGWFPVFNIADCGIVVGGALLAAGVLLAEHTAGQAGNG